MVQNALNKEDDIKQSVAWLPACELLKHERSSETDPVKSILIKDTGVARDTGYSIIARTPIVSYPKEG